METEDITAAFHLFNVSQTGTMSKAELYDIFVFEDSPHSIPQAAEIARALIAEFDEDRDGELSLAEFTSAVRANATLGGDIQANGKYQISLYDRRARPHGKEIRALFDKLDVSGTGKLAVEELKDAVAFFEGAEFDEQTFLYWYARPHALARRTRLLRSCSLHADLHVCTHTAL